MSSFFEQLVADHSNLQRILELLRHEIHGRSHCSELDAELPLILDVLDYIKAYPETFHHPLEEAAFDLLTAKSLIDPSVLKPIRDQHLQLEQFTDRLHLRFLQLANGLEEDTTLIDDLSLFIDLQEEHIESENRHIMPALQHKISEGDWWDIASVLTLNKDPLFDQKLRNQFKVLARRIFHDSPIQAPG